MGEAALRRKTVDEFLAWDGEADRRYQLISGEIVAMAPPSPEHSLIAANAIGEIRQRLTPPCKAMSEAGIRLPWRDDCYYQADAAISCSSLIPGQWGTVSPVVIVEILSPSTIAQDRLVKLPDYRHIDSVQHIVLIASSAILVEHWRRGEGVWTVVEIEAGGVLRLDAIGAEIPVDALYAGLDFTAAASRAGA